jgi:hypothetical protein
MILMQQSGTSLVFVANAERIHHLLRRKTMNKEENKWEDEEYVEWLENKIEIQMEDKNNGK